jgi:hypothetical protein
MITSLAIEQESLSWYCQGGEEDEYCGVLNTASLASVEYQHQGQPRGAVIALPHCQCGAQTFLKADYSLKELYKCLQAVTDEETGAIAYVLPLRFVRNLHVHWLLHQSGKAEHAPILSMPPQALLEHPSFSSAKPETVYALWFGYSTIRAYKPKELASKQTLLLEEA